MPNPQLKTSLLLQDWRNGNPKALDQLLSEHLPWLCRKARGRLTPALRSKDNTMFYVQEAILAFLQDAPRFQIENGKLFRALLFRILENTMLEHYRYWRAKRRDLAREKPIPADTVLNLESPSPNPCEIAIAHEEEAWVRLSMEFLKPLQQRVLLLRLYEKKSYEEIGALLGGKTADAMRMFFNRSLNKLSEIKRKLQQGQLRSVLHAGDALRNG